MKLSQAHLDLLAFYRDRDVADILRIAGVVQGRLDQVRNEIRDAGEAAIPLRLMALAETFDAYAGAFRALGESYQRTLLLDDESAQFSLDGLRAANTAQAALVAAGTKKVN